MNTSWLLPVPLKQDELFSTWLTRAALTQGCDPLVLTGHIWPEWPAWSRDLDRGVPDDYFLALSKASGISVEDLKNSCLYQTVKMITDQALDKLTIWPWIIAQGHRNKKYKTGLQYCSACLADDHIPYYRKQWRFAWHVGCHTHNIKLNKHCWNCNIPVQPHRLEAEDKHLAICFNCKQDLRNAPQIKSSENLLTFQNLADSVIKSQSAYFGSKKISSHEWFALARFFLLLLNRAATQPKSNVATMIKMLGISPKQLIISATGLQIEMLPIEEREVLLSGIPHLLETKVECFIEAIEFSSTNRSTFYGIDKKIPESLKPIINKLPENPKIRNTVKDSNKSQKPRSKRAVERMYARLQRKLPIKTS